MAIDDRFFFDPENVPSAMKTRRQKLGLTHEQLSRLTKAIDLKAEGVSRVALSRYETGASLPGLRELRLIALSLRCPLSQLVYGEMTDPMLRYRLALEMRITETVMGAISAAGVIKDDLDNDPESPAYRSLIEQAREPSS